MRKIGSVAAAIALMLAAVGSWASLTIQPRVESSPGAHGSIQLKAAHGGARDSNSTVMTSRYF